MRRRRQQHQVHARREHLLVGVEAGESPLRGHVDPRAAPRTSQVLQAPLQAVGEKVAHGHEPHRPLGAQGLAAGAAAAVAAADEADPDRFAAGGMGGAGDAQRSAATAPDDFRIWPRASRRWRWHDAGRISSAAPIASSGTVRRLRFTLLHAEAADAGGVFGRLVAVAVVDADDHAVAGLDGGERLAERLLDPFAVVPRAGRRRGS